MQNLAVTGVTIERPMIERNLLLAIALRHKTPSRLLHRRTWVVLWRTVSGGAPVGLRNAKITSAKVTPITSGCDQITGEYGHAEDFP